MRWFSAMNGPAKCPGGDRDCWGSLIWTRQARSRFLARVLGRDGNARITQACATRDARRCDGGAVSRRCASNWPSAVSYALLRAAYSENSQHRRRLLSTEPGNYLERRWGDGVAWPAGPGGHAGTGGADWTVGFARAAGPSRTGRRGRTGGKHGSDWTSGTGRRSGFGRYPGSDRTDWTDGSNRTNGIRW